MLPSSAPASLRPHNCRSHASPPLVLCLCWSSMKRLRRQVCFQVPLFSLPSLHSTLIYFSIVKPLVSFLLRCLSPRSSIDRSIYVINLRHRSCIFPRCSVVAYIFLQALDFLSFFLSFFFLSFFCLSFFLFSFFLLSFFLSQEDNSP